VTLTSDLQWTAHKAVVVKRAERALNMVAGAGVSRGLFSTKIALRLWNVLVRPVVEHASAVWGGGAWKEADALQYRAGRVILRVMESTPKAAVRGELGWQRMECHRDWIAVRYWSRLVPVNGAQVSRYVVQMYGADRRRADISGTLLSTRTPARAPVTFVGLTHVAFRCLHTYGLLSYWRAQNRKPPAGDMNAYHNQPTPKDRSSLSLFPALKLAVAKNEQSLWWDDVGRLTSLRTYVRVKRRLELEVYLQDEWGVGSVSGRTAAMDMARLRCGANALAVSAARRNDHVVAVVIGGSGQQQRRTTAPVPLQQRVCTWCSERLQHMDMARLGGAGMAPVEDEEHALLWCGLYARARLQLFDAVRAVTEVRDAAGRHVLAAGSVDLCAMTRSAESTERSAASALAIVLGGLSGTSKQPLKYSSEQRRIAQEVQQLCKAFVGRLTQQRREWHQLRLRRLAAHSAADLRLQQQQSAVGTAHSRSSRGSRSERATATVAAGRRLLLQRGGRRNGGGGAASSRGGGRGADGGGVSQTEWSLATASGGIAAAQRQVQSGRAGSRLLRRRGAASGTARRRLLFDARMVARDRSQQQEQQHQHEQQQQKQQLREQKNEADCVRPIGERDAESMPEGL
jgi:hypothetical protein